MWRRNRTKSRTPWPAAASPTTGRRIGLVGCVKAKRSERAPAQDLYTSTLFTGRRRWVEQTCDCWYILSAKHGLLHPGTLIDPYEQALAGTGRAERRQWAQWVFGQLVAEAGDVSGSTFEVHAGADYRDFGLVETLMGSGATVEVPAAGLRQGEQLALYARGPDDAARLQR